MEGIALRYGFFYGLNTWYCPEGAAADHARRREMPIIGLGEGVWSFVHIEDAALATVAALTAPPPPRLTEREAREVAGEDAVYYGTKLCGASNGKAKKILDFKPLRLQWLNP